MREKRSVRVSEKKECVKKERKRNGNDDNINNNPG